MKLFIYLAFLSTVFSENDERNYLHFLAIGDWGKGGNSGNILRTFSSSDAYGLGSVPSAIYQRNGFVRKNFLRKQHSVMENKDPDREDGGPEGENGGPEHGEGREHYTYQAAVAKAMANYASHSDVPPEFVLALGDNFYDDGVKSTNDSLWNSLWRDVYLTNYTSLRVPWYPVLGNHDYGYGVQGANAQVDRYKNKKALNVDDFTSNLWKFKALNYSETFHIPGGGKVVCVFVDTTTLAPSENDCCNEDGGVSYEEQSSRIDNQLRHIQYMLSEAVASKPTWLIVIGHYPIYSYGDHGDTSELVNYLQPLIKEFNVSMYLSGHDHISEHLRAGGTEYFVSGAGAQTDNMGDTASAADLVWNGTGYSAFTAFRASNTTLCVVYINWNGTVVYKYTMYNPHQYMNHSEFSDDPGGGNPGMNDSPHRAKRKEKDKEDYIIPVTATICGVVTIALLACLVFSKSKQKVVNSNGLKKPKRNSYTRQLTLDNTSDTWSEDDVLSISQSGLLSRALNTPSNQESRGKITYVGDKGNYHRKSMSLPAYIT